MTLITVDFDDPHFGNRFNTFTKGVLPSGSQAVKLHTYCPSKRVKDFHWNSWSFPSAGEMGDSHRHCRKSCCCFFRKVSVIQYFTFQTFR